MHCVVRGFVREAVKRKNNWIEGEWRDTILMGITEGDWDMRIRALKDNAVGVTKQRASERLS